MHFKIDGHTDRPPQGTAYAFRWYPMWFLVLNVIVGALFIPLAYWAAVRFGERLLRYPWIARFNDDLAGRSLAVARARLREIAEFRREMESPPPVGVRIQCAALRGSSVESSPRRVRFETSVSTLDP